MNTDFGARLKEFRERTRMSQQEFGDACMLSQKTVSNLEKGRAPKASYLDQIEAGFPSLNMAWLRKGIGEMTGRTLAPLPAQQADYTSGPATVNTVVETLLRERLADKDTLIEMLRAELSELRGKPSDSSDAAGPKGVPTEPTPAPVFAGGATPQPRLRVQGLVRYAEDAAELSK